MKFIGACFFLKIVQKSFELKRFKNVISASLQLKLRFVTRHNIHV